MWKPSPTLRHGLVSIGRGRPFSEEELFASPEEGGLRGPRNPKDLVQEGAVFHEQTTVPCRRVGLWPPLFRDANSAMGAVQRGASAIAAMEAPSLCSWKSGRAPAQICLSR